MNIGQSPDPVFKRSLQCLGEHCHPEWGDRTPLDVFNRLLAKNIRPAGWTESTHLNIQPAQVSSRREQWTTGALAALPRGHASAVGIDVDCPIVIAEYEGVRRLLDGNHRVNRWVASGDARLHWVHIHVVAASGHVVEHAAIGTTPP